jgi:hypothetical protein
MSTVTDNDEVIITDKNITDGHELTDDQLLKIVNDYEQQHGNININMFCLNEQDTHVWADLPLSQEQKKYVIITILNAGE